MSNSIRTLVASVVTVLFSISLFDALFNLNKVIVPGVSNIYNALGTSISPNLITVVIFDFRGYDTLGESIILLTAGLVVLLVFGRGRFCIMYGNNDYFGRTYNSWRWFPRWSYDYCRCYSMYFGVWIR